MPRRINRLKSRDFQLLTHFKLLKVMGNSGIFSTVRKSMLFTTEWLSGN